MNAYALVYDRQLAAPLRARPFFSGGKVRIPLSGLDRDIAAATLRSAQGIAALALDNRGDGTGELALTPAGTPPGRFAFDLVVRYSDGIQHVDDKLAGELIVPAELAIRFTEHGTVRVDFPFALAVAPALVDPGSYRIEALEARSVPLRIRSVGREERRIDPATGRPIPVSDPRYVELFVLPEASGAYRLTISPLLAFAGGMAGPWSGSFTARLVKRAFAERTIGPHAAHAHELPPGVVLSALFAEDERAGGRGGRRG